jgi:hypothetical protein
MSPRPANDDVIGALIRFTQDDDLLRHIVSERDLAAGNEAAIRRALERLLSRFGGDLAFGLGYDLRDKSEDRRFAVGLLALNLVYAAIVCDRTGVRDEAAVSESVVRAFAEPAALLLRIEPATVAALAFDARDLLRNAEQDLIRDIRAMVERDLSLIAKSAPMMRRDSACSPVRMALTGLPGALPRASADEAHDRDDDASVA